VEPFLRQRKTSCLQTALNASLPFPWSHHRGHGHA
jgi:hypothetical protein